MGILKNVKKIKDGIKWLREHRKSALLIAIFCISLVIIVGASFTLAGFQLVIVLLICGMLIIFTFIKMLYSFLKDMAKRDIETDNLNKEKNTLEGKINRLRKELQFERRGGIKVKIRPILEMGFLEAECEVSKFFDIYLDENGNEIIEAESEEEQEEELKIEEIQKDYRFLGGLIAKFRARYGIELQKVYVKRDDESQTLFISGAKPSFLGTRGYPQMMWEGSVCLKSGLFFSEWVTDKNSLKFERDCREKYSRDLQKSLKNGPEQLDWVKEPLQRNINRLFKIIAQGYKMVSVEKPTKDFVSISKYLGHLGLTNGTDRLLPP